MRAHLLRSAAFYANVYDDPQTGGSGGFFTYLDQQYGGSEGYLKQKIGLTDADIAKLRKTMLD